MDGNNVSYTYDPGGRIANILDGTGLRKLGYDALGNLVHEDRYVAIPNSNHTLAFHTAYTYDSWGRMRSMTYPDEERVDYTYRWGGDLFSVHGTKGADSYRYVDSIAYNAHGQRAYIRYGNGTRATYAYDSLHRLTQLRCYDSPGDTMQEIKYAFDQAGNITGISNSAGAIGTLGGSYANHYRYDALHRLATAEGPGFFQDYHITPAGRPATTQQHLFGDEAMKYYAYSRYHQPHAPRRIYVESIRPELHDLRWDQAGNLGQVSTRDEHSGDVRSRFLYWTEDNRLHTVVDDRYHSYYAYDHAGERTLKIAGPCDALDVSAWVMHSHSPLQKFTLYPSPYVVVSDHGYTKHYYAGTERLAARQGGGFGKKVLYEQQGGITGQANTLFKQSLDNILERRLQEDPGVHREEHLEAVFGKMHPGVHASQGLIANAGIYNSYFLRLMGNLVAHAPEREVYFYHSDHLGSASWITDAGGLPVQHLQYLPYGEPYINQRTTGYNERFTFTGKERDEETGYGYFGARYMDHELTTSWLSVDPLADKYPSLSPYNYCAWNPIKLVDPDGREVSTHTDEWGNVIAVFDDGDNGVYMHKGDAQARVNKHYSAENTSAGGRYMGESLHSLSFADQSLYNETGEVAPMPNMVVDYGSSELTLMANMIMDQEPSLLQYGINAGTGGDWDIKAHVSHGSKLYGKYASPRDAGNFVAGMVAASKGSVIENVAQFGYGAYNLSGNDKVKTAGIVAATVLLRATNPIIGIPFVGCVMNGEDKLSQRCIDMGKAYQQQKMNKR